MLVGDNFLTYLSSAVLATPGENESSALQFILFYVPFVRMEYKIGFQNQLIFYFCHNKNVNYGLCRKLKQFPSIIEYSHHTNYKHTLIRACFFTGISHEDIWLLGSHDIPIKKIIIPWPEFFNSSLKCPKSRIKAFSVYRNSKFQSPENGTPNILINHFRQGPQMQLLHLTATWDHNWMGVNFIYQNL